MKIPHALQEASNGIWIALMGMLMLWIGLVAAVVRWVRRKTGPQAALRPEQSDRRFTLAGARKRRTGPLRGLYGAMRAMFSITPRQQ